jgi:hypothetical protein
VSRQLAIQQVEDGPEVGMSCYAQQGPDMIMQASIMRRGLSNMRSVKTGTPRAQQGEGLLAAAVGQMKHTTWPDSSGNHHRQHTGQRQHHLQGSPQEQEAAQVEQHHTHRWLEGAATAAVSSCYHSHQRHSHFHCHDDGCCSCHAVGN